MDGSTATTTNPLRLLLSAALTLIRGMPLALLYLVGVPEGLALHYLLRLLLHPNDALFNDSKNEPYSSWIFEYPLCSRLPRRKDAL